jgi:MscS family membrane protein
MIIKRSTAGIGLILRLIGLMLVAGLVPVHSLSARTPDALELSAAVDTSTPNSTVRGFIASSQSLAESIMALNGRGAAPGAVQSIPSLEAVAVDYASQAATAIDLSNVPPNILERSKLERVLRLYEVLRRVPQSVLAAAPVDGRSASWSIPNTPIKIVRMDAGPQRGQFVFSSDTIEDIDSIYDRALTRRPEWGAGGDSYRIVKDNLGGLRPTVLKPVVDRLPAPLLKPVKGNSIWGWVALLAVLSAGTGVTLLAFVAVRRLAATSAFAQLLVAGLPVLILRIMSFLTANLVGTLHMSETTDWFIRTVLESVGYAAWAWFLVVMTAWLSHHAPPRFCKNDSIKAAVLRLSIRFLGVIFTGIVIARGLEQIGVPLYGIVAGLGVGGLALALAAQPTAENLIAGVILFVDQPARVGDECEFEGYRGVVEEIGIRSTAIRLSDGTLLTLTNSQFCNMKIRNLGVGQHQFALELPFASNTPASRLHCFMEDMRALLASDEETLANTARVEIDSITAQGIVVKISGHFSSRVPDPDLAWQLRQIAILEVAQKHEMLLATVG